METVTLQEEIKTCIAKLNWSQKKLARIIYTETHDYDNSEEIKKFEESLKKELNRNTKKPERLKEYLMIISRHEEFKKLNLIVPAYVSTGILNDSLEKEMEKISKLIHENISNDL